MKRFAYYIICCSLVALFSCTHDDIDEVLTPVGDGKITIQSTLDDMAITRAEVDDTKPERTITHIDIFAIDQSGNIDYYERNTTGNNEGAAVDGAGVLTLSVSRRAKDASDNYIFEQGVNYKFILVANATAESDAMAAAATLADLEKLVQDDSFETSFAGEEGSTSGNATGSTPTMSRQTLLHLSGTDLGENPDKKTPQTFLMDAVVTDTDGNKEWLVNPASGTVPTLNLSADFKRAASKVIVNITQGEDVEFRTQLGSESAQYDFYKLPASTFVLPNESKLVNIQLINTAPMKHNTDTFIWEYTDASDENPRNENTIQVIGYAYSHSWSDVDLTNETSLILNIPMMWNKDNSDDHSKEADAPKSWYKVPLSQGKKFERNKCYIVNIVINAVGASTRSTAIELRDIEYKTLDWQNVSINVGDSSENPKYLILNTDLVEMYNVNFDNTSLEFSSSSAITSVTLKDVYKQNADGTFTAATDSHRAYYINKFGIYTDLSSTVRGTISATAEQNVLNGGISILSPIVPATAAEVEKQILEQLGPAPTAPTLTEPTYDGTIPTAPDVVNEPTEPDPDNYKRNQSTTTNWSGWSSWSDYTYNNGSEDNSTIRTRTRTRTRTTTEYQCIENGDGTYTFQMRTGTQTQTQTATSTRQNTNRLWGDAQNQNTYSEYVYTEWTTDTTTQTRWDNAITEYNNQVAAYEEYLDDLAQYEADMAVLNEKPEYQQYLADKAAYDAALADYNARLADYNERADAIRAATGGEETHYNTIRYLEFEVKNAEGLTATFRVMQYPVIYVTNQQGWYSYRDDFNSHYQNKGNRYVRIALEMDDNDWTGNYKYDTSAGASGYFWQSKVVSSYNENTGKSTTSFYSWSQTSNNATATIGGSCETEANARMYHIRVTATSKDYTIGRPRLDSNGFTLGDADNSQLVSPSFMIASRLGAIYSSYGGLSEVEDGEDNDDDGVADRLEIFREHCKQYVEVYKDANGNPVKFDDWRLPTEQEIKIIISLQGTETEDAPAIDFLLNGYYYMSASGPVYNNKGNNDNTNTSAIRCVRDAY